MSDTHLPQHYKEQLRPNWRKTGLDAFIALVIVFALTLGYGPADVERWTYLFTDAGNMAIFLADFLQPNFEDWEKYISKMYETICITVWGTVLSVIVGVPCGLLSSSNIAPAWIVQPMRRLMDAARAINELVFAILFVAAVGLGPFAGVMALFIHNFGIVAKLFSEAVEAIDPRPVEGIRATGASKLQEIIYGVIPQVIPLWTSYSLYRFESVVPH